MAATQQSFDLEPPRTRSFDPLSSHRAEAEVKHSGAMAGGRAIAKQLVDRYPGRTAKQLERLGALNQITLCRRLPECDLVQVHCASHEAIWFPKCECSPWCEHIRAKELCEEYGRIRITDGPTGNRHTAEYEWVNGAAELQLQFVGKKGLRTVLFDRKAA